MEFSQKEKRIGDLANEICNFLLELAAKYPDRSDNHELPFSEFAYASALDHWRRTGKDSRAFFSLKDDEDSSFIEFRNEITERFGLRILTDKEAIEEHRSGKFITKKVNETTWLN